MNYLIGKIDTIFQANRRSEANRRSDRFTVQDFILNVDYKDTEKKYPNKIKIWVSNKHLQELEGHEPGDIVKVEYKIEGREVNNKLGQLYYLINIVCTGIMKHEDSL